MADQLFCEKRLDWDAHVTEVLSLARRKQRAPNGAVSRNGRLEPFLPEP